MYFSRGKNKIQDLAGVIDSYNFYIGKYKDNRLYNIKYKLYKNLIVDYYTSIMNEIFRGYRYKLPHRLGYLYITKRLVNIRKLTNHGINWVESVKNKKVVYYLNSHSKNYIYRFMWRKENTKVPNLYFYKFVASRTNKRNLAQIIKNRQCDYFEN